jgi:hypothetical protein
VQLPVLREAFVSTAEFINFWSKQYSYENDHLYDDNIGKELIEDRIWALFKWKNGGPLSKKKQASVKENFINEIPCNLDNVNLLTYLNKAGGAIWRIFWLHCNRPNIYPIYDQHVHRAMAKLKNWGRLEIPSKNKVKVEMYINHYLPFWREFLEYPPKKVDEALWSYGKFLKLKYDFIRK